MIILRSPTLDRWRLTMALTWRSRIRALSSGRSFIHFRDSPGMHHRDKISEMLVGYIPGYDKNVKYSMFSGGYQQAVTRAKRLDTRAERDGDAGRNPTTGVYRLTEIIRG